MPRIRIAVLLIFLCLLSPPVRADAMQEVQALYGRFLAAQNARDLAGVRALLLDSDRFLWVSDGRSVWGPDALIARMTSFQKAEVWQVDPDLAHAVPVEVDADTAYLHLPLVLTIGPAAKPDRLRFLVSVLGVRKPEGWRIAALFTTEDKSS